MFLFQELKWRNLVKDLSNEKELEKLLNQGKINFYCGFDPTAISLTIGHLVQITIILLLQKKGHNPFILLGRATSLIGDPKEKEERKLLSLEDVDKNFVKIKKQLMKILPKDKVIFVDNYEWISKINLIDFLRDYGKYFNVNYMISKEKIAKRLDKGISYTEFSYIILQSLDFYFLYKKYDVNLQLGGSDQWGNITSGLELIRKKNLDKLSKKPFGMSSSLLLDNKGVKIGKSEKNAIWLDEKLTTPYQIYQFFLNVDDQNVINYLKMLTLLEVDKILELEKEVKLKPSYRLAQKELAKQIVSFVHGKEIFKECFEVNNILFFDKSKVLNENDFFLLKKYLVSIEVKEKKISLVNALLETKLADSKKKARTLIISKSIKIFNKSIDKVDYVLDFETSLCSKYILLTKKNKINALIIFKF
ncbi:tyrosine--tRNA ligase [Candidatus Phytoplasma sp. AldY-WA1]|uniref:tyrosine--tRNA ligase n=1 Tax=Candidatus Phytoplasma sp. AldY-WA1 TaxID=2852100 RepID=UPI001CE309DD|nr:tyrosine--tRNA ligase [Candidatus Phytoplasma sp. AldY-WA1]